MESWKVRLLALLTVMATLSSIAGPALADGRGDCRRFHGDLYCEVDWGNQFVNYFDNAFVFYPYPYFYPYSYFHPYSYYNNDCGFDWGGPVNPYDCFD